MPTSPRELSSVATPSSTRSYEFVPLFPSSRVRREIDHRLLRVRLSNSVVDSRSTDSENSEYVEQDSEVECVFTQ
uniref:Uncharacterized protein n=1 Tax=Oryza punctata TaxID=4537 RepID=A0A0E0LYJ8_ORYPU